MNKRLIFLTILSFFTFVEAEEMQTLTVSGSASLTHPADLASLKVGVITEDQNADMASNLNNEKMNQVIAALKKMGLSEKEIQTTQYQISPKYSQRPKNASSDWKSQIIGFEVSNKVQIETEKLNLIPQLLSASTKSGANVVEDIRFSIKDPLEVQNEAIKQAVTQAFSHAKAAEVAAKISIKGVHQININPSATVPRFQKVERFALASSAPIAPGDVGVDASVTVIFEIGSP